MIDLHKEIDSMQENMNMTYENNTTPTRKKHNILTFILCLVISLAIWIYVANVDIIKESNNTQNDVQENVENT